MNAIPTSIGDPHVEADTSMLDQFSEVDLNDSPNYSVWPARLLGISDWSNRVRKDELITREYGEKYQRLQNAFESQSFSNLSAALQGLDRTQFQNS